MSSALSLKQSTLPALTDDRLVQEASSPVISNGDDRTPGPFIRRYLAALPKPPISPAARDNQASSEADSLPVNSRVLPKIPALQMKLRSTYHALQEWEGYVQSIGEEEFGVVLCDLTSPQNAKSTTTLPISDLTDEERQALDLGSIFRWTIGYERTPAGQKKRVSRIIFRQMPQWTDAEIAASEDAAKKQTESIVWD